MYGLDNFGSLFIGSTATYLLFGLVLLVYWFVVFFIVYHLLRFGIGVKPKLVAFVFFIGSVVLVFPTLVFFQQVDFQEVVRSLTGSINFNIQDGGDGSNKGLPPLPTVPSF